MGEAERKEVTVTVMIMSREYAVTCKPDEQDALRTSAAYLDDRMSAIRRRGKALGAERIAVMTALNLARELLAMKGHDAVASQNAEAIEKVRQLGLDIDHTLAVTD